MISERALPLEGDSGPVARLPVALMLFMGLISTSAAWHLLGLGSAGISVSVVAGGIAWLLLVEGRRIDQFPLVLGLLLFASAAVPALYWADMRLVAYPLFLVLAILLVALSTTEEVSRFVEIGSWILLVVLVGAVVGFVLAQIGAEPIAQFVNRDGRTTGLFFTTLSNIRVGNFIRPSGIYDEPGTLGFITGAVVYLRFATGKAMWLTYALLLLGFITFSLAHVVFALVFAAALLSRRHLPTVTVWLAVGVAAVILSGAVDLFQQYLLARVTINQAVGGGLAGGRLQLLVNASDALGTYAHAGWVGLHPDCTFAISQCNQIAGYLAENPLGPLAAQGMFLSWPYYVFVAVALLAPFAGRMGIAFAAVGLLFLQRPYVSSWGYALLAVISLMLFLRRGATHWDRARQDGYSDNPVAASAALPTR